MPSNPVDTSLGYYGGSGQPKEFVKAYLKLDLDYLDEIDTDVEVLPATVEANLKSQGLLYLYDERLTWKIFKPL
jgi:hypothetical protein